MSRNNTECIIMRNSAIGATKAILSLLPFGSVIAEVISIAGSVRVDSRLLSLEERVSKLEMSKEDFIDHVKRQCDNDHKYYAIRKAFKGYVLEVFPEVEGIAQENIIDLALNEDTLLAEHLSDIIIQLNSDDVRLLRYLKEYSKANNFTISYEWKEFKEFVGLLGDTNSVGDMLMRVYADVRDTNIDNPSYDYVFMSQSILKLQMQGVLRCYYSSMRYGSSAHDDFERIQLTILGQKLLEYIDRD